MAHNICKPITQQKFRIALKPVQYEMIRTSLMSHITLHKLDFAAQAPYMELFIAIDRMIESIPGRVPDSALISNEHKKRGVRYNVESLGLDEEARVLGMSEAEAEVYWKQKQKEL